MNKESSSSRMMAVFHGASPPRNTLEIAIAMEGEAARKAMRRAYKPRPRAGELPPEMFAPLEKRKESGSWDAAIGLLVLFLVAACIFC